MLTGMNYNHNIPDQHWHPHLYRFHQRALNEAWNSCILQALETVKMLSGMEPCYSGSLFLFDGLDGRGRVVKLRRRRDGAQVGGRGVKYTPWYILTDPPVPC